MFEKIQQVQSRHKMRPLFHPGTSPLTFLYLALLLPVPPAVTSYPHSPSALRPTVDEPELDSTFLQLQATLDDPSDAWAEAWPKELLLEPNEEKEEQPWDKAVLLRSLRGDLVARPLSPFPGGHSLDSLHYQDGGEAEDGGKRKEALTFIAGGLQAVSREKGGFGFRFGRK